MDTTPFGSPCRGQKRRSEPFHSVDGGPSEARQFFVRDGTAGRRLAKKWLCGMGPQGEDGWRIA